MIFFFLLFALFVCHVSCTIPPNPIRFNFTGAVQTYTVPSGVTSVLVRACGASGGRSSVGGRAGSGGCVTSTLNVQAWSQLLVYVGGQGKGSGDGCVSGCCP
jgi:hypothetical protein